MQKKRHLAQLNIARIRYDQVDDPEMDAFYQAIDGINAQAEQQPGFVWRWVEEASLVDPVEVFGDPKLVVNMSVWESVQALQDFVYQGEHLAIYRRKKEWFEAMSERHLVLWWITPGHYPSLQEAKQKLETFRENGPSPEAFDFGTARTMLT